MSLEFSETKTGCVSNYDNPDCNEDAFIKEQVELYNNNPYRFLFYPWGVWVTAYARRNLFSGISAAGGDYIYSDTDSLKMTNHEKHLDYIEKYNEKIIKKLEDACEFHGLDKSVIRPKNKDGVEKPLGVWDFEGVYDEFKTLGAKRYMHRIGTEWTLTCAGVNKIKGRNYLLKKTKEINEERKKKGLKSISPLKLFNLDLVFPVGEAGRTLVTYIDEEVQGAFPDYLGNMCEFHELTGIHMEEEMYSLNTVDSFIRFLFTIREEQW